MSLVSALRVRELCIPFKNSFRHAAAERSATSSVWVEAVAADGTVGYGESCPRPYVTGETTDSVQAFIAAHEADLCRAVDTVEALRAWMTRRREVIDTNPAGWCAVELALLDLLAKQRRQTVEAMLGLPVARGPFRFTAVLGDAAPESFAAMARQYGDRGFTDYKIKLSGDLARDRAKLGSLQGLAVPEIRVRGDANNLWHDPDMAIAFLRELNSPLYAVEEPIPAGRYDDLARVGEALNCLIVLDESLVRANQIDCLPPPSSRWIANVRVSKMGGLLRSLEVVRAAQAHGIGVIVGAQVGESSLLTRVALTVATAAGGSLVAQEGAFGTHLLQYDVCTPPVMFGAAGALTPPDAVLDGAGFGIHATTETS